MKLENMFKKKKNMTDGKDSSKTRILNGENIRTERKRPEVPEGLLK